MDSGHISETHYFGPWCDPESALEKYLVHKDYLRTGRKLPEQVSGPTLGELVKRFLLFKRDRVTGVMLNPKPRATGVSISGL